MNLSAQQQIWPGIANQMPEIPSQMQFLLKNVKDPSLEKTPGILTNLKLFKQIKTAKKQK